MTRHPVIVAALACVAGSIPRVLSCAEAEAADVTIGPCERAEARLVATEEIEISYGEDATSPGFAPAGDEREARGPNAIEVDDDGTIRLSDSLRRTVFSVRAHPSGRPSIGVLGDLPPRPEPSSGGVPTATRVVKTSGEDGAIVFSDDGVERRVAVETGRPLASIRLLGVDRRGRAFVVVETFRERGRTAVDREVLVVEKSGALAARAALTVPPPIVPPLTDMYLTENGVLYVLSTGTDGARVVRFEVRP
jgi:hypothetical protein